MPKKVIEKPVEKIGNDEIVMVDNPLVKGSKITVKTITLKSTYDNMNGNTDEMDAMNYDDVKEYVEKHRKQLFGKHTNIQINILTAKGWRNGLNFKNGKIDWYDAKVKYGESVHDIEDVYAVQIYFWDKY